MNSVPRKLTLGLGLAFVVAACGDDVTVQEPTPGPAPVVRSVVVSPASATVAPGGSFTFGAAVEADAGLARTVTWSSSNTSVATVDNGVASASSAPAGGVTSICAASTVDANIKGCAQLTVTPAAPPATVQIDNITAACHVLNGAHPAFAGCGQLVPVQTNNVFGQIDIGVLVQRPSGVSSGITAVRLEILNAAGTVEDTYTESLSGEFLAGDDAVAFQQGLSNRVTFSVQTAKYDLSGAGGTAKVYHPNGAKRIRASLIGGSGATATAETGLTFRNANGFHMNITTNLASGNNANGSPISQIQAGTGLVWKGGTPLAVQAIPVSYTGQAVIASAGTTVNFGSALCDASGTGARGVAATVSGGIMSGTIPYTAGSGAAATDLDVYNTAPGCAAAGEAPFAIAIDATNNPFINIGLAAPFGGNTLNVTGFEVNPALNSIPLIRLDNAGPAAIAGYTANPNGRQNGWYNGAVQLNVRTASNADGIIAGGTPADVGFGGTVTLTAHGGTCTSAASCGALPARTRVTDAPALAESPTGATYNVMVRSTDVFGNFTNGGINPFGVDVTVPTVAVVQAGAPATQVFFNALNGFTPAAATWTFTAIDVAPALPAIASGIRTANVADPRIDGLEVTLASRTASASVAFCPATVQLQLTTLACANAAPLSGWLPGTQTFGFGPGVPLAIDPTGANTQAYYNTSAVSVDQAGNRSASTTRGIIFDITPPVLTALNNVFAVGNTTTTAGSLTSNAGSTDNLDNGFAHFLANYAGGINPGLGGAPIAQPMSLTGSGAQTAQLFGFNAAGPSILAFQYTRAFAPFYRTLVQVGAAACPAFLPAGPPAPVCGTPAVTAWAATSLVSSGFTAFDVALNPAAAPLATGVAANTFAGSHPLTTGFGGGNTFGIAGYTSTALTTTEAAVTVSSGTAATRQSVLAATIEVVAGAQSPFVGGLDFWYLDTDLGVWALACTAATPVYSIANTTWTYSCTWDSSTANSRGYLIPTTITGVANASAIVAIGRNVLGDGLMSNPYPFTINP